MEAQQGLRIESDGTTEGTFVYLDGLEVHDVTAVTWNFSPKSRKTTVTLEISNVALTATMDAVLEQVEKLTDADHRSP